MTNFRGLNNDVDFWIRLKQGVENDLCWFELSNVFQNSPAPIKTFGLNEVEFVMSSVGLSDLYKPKTMKSAAAWTDIGPAYMAQLMTSRLKISTVEPQFNEVAEDQPNLFVKSKVRYIENLDITNLRGNDQNVRYIEVIVND